MGLPRCSVWARHVWVVGGRSGAQGAKFKGLRGFIFPGNFVTMWCNAGRLDEDAVTWRAFEVPHSERRAVVLARRGIELDANSNAAITDGADKAYCSGAAAGNDAAPSDRDVLQQRLSIGCGVVW